MSNSRKCDAFAKPDPLYDCNDGEICDQDVGECMPEDDDIPTLTIKGKKYAAADDDILQRLKETVLQYEKRTCDLDGEYQCNEDEFCDPKDFKCSTNKSKFYKYEHNQIFKGKDRKYKSTKSDSIKAIERYYNNILRIDKDCDIDNTSNCFSYEKCDIDAKKCTDQFADDVVSYNHNGKTYVGSAKTIDALRKSLQPAEEKLVVKRSKSPKKERSKSPKKNDRSRSNSHSRSNSPSRQDKGKGRKSRSPSPSRAKTPPQRRVFPAPSAFAPSSSSTPVPVAAPVVATPVNIALGCQTTGCTGTKAGYFCNVQTGNCNRFKPTPPYYTDATGVQVYGSFEAIKAFLDSQGRKFSAKYGNQVWNDYEAARVYHSGRVKTAPVPVASPVVYTPAGTPVITPSPSLAGGPIPASMANVDRSKCFHPETTAPCGPNQKCSTTGKCVASSYKSKAKIGNTIVQGSTDSALKKFFDEMRMTPEEIAAAIAGANGKQSVPVGTYVSGAATPNAPGTPIVAEQRLNIPTRHAPPVQHTEGGMPINPEAIVNRIADDDATAQQVITAFSACLSRSLGK
jgi:hypothetical protein